MILNLYLPNNFNNLIEFNYDIFNAIVFIISSIIYCVIFLYKLGILNEKRCINIYDEYY